MVWVILAAGKGVFSSLDINISGAATGGDYLVLLIVLNPWQQEQYQGSRVLFQNIMSENG